MKNILIFLFPGFELLEFSPFIDVFGWNNILSKNKVNTTTMSFKKNIISSWNITLEVDTIIDLKNIDQFDALIIPGGFGSYGFFDNSDDENFKQLLNFFIDNKKIIIGICTGSLILAKNLCLKNIPATTYLLENKRYFNQLQKYGAIPKEKNIVHFNNIITSSGPSSAIKVAFLLLKLLTSEENMKKVMKNMEY